MRGWWFTLIIWFIKLSCPRMQAKVESGRLSKWAKRRQRRREGRPEGSTPSEGSSRSREKSESSLRWSVVWNALSQVRDGRR